MNGLVLSETTKNESPNMLSVEELSELMAIFLRGKLGATADIQTIERGMTDLFQQIRKISTPELIEEQDVRGCCCPKCQTKMEIVRKEPRTIRGLVDYVICRRYFHCPHCDHYEKPLDVDIGCQGAYTTDLKEAMILLGQRLPFGEASLMLEKLMKVTVSHETIQTYTEAVGLAIATDEAMHVAEVVGAEGYILNDASEVREAAIPGIAYMELDGSMIQTREEGWKETRIGILFQESDKMEVDKHHTQIAHKHHFSVFNSDKESFKAFKDRTTQEAHDFGFHRYTTAAILADGAPWIWDYASTYHPYAVQILDYYHASEYLGNALNSIPVESEQRELLFNWLQDGQVPKIVGWLLLQTSTTEISTCIRYYEKNKERMHYNQYKQKGLNVGSGAIESTHRTLSQARMKQSGMHWGIANVQSMLSLRAMFLSNKWDSVVNDYIKAA